MGIFESVIFALALGAAVIVFGGLIGFVSNGFSSFDPKNPKNLYPVDGKWLTANEIFDRYM